MLCKRFFRLIGLTLISLAMIGVGDASAQQRELHTIALYESQGGNPVTVEVDRPGQQVTLFLTAYESINWQVSATPGTTIESVILGGYESQSVGGLAPEVAVLHRDRSNTSGEYLRGDYELTSPDTRNAMRTLNELTGLDFSSFQGAYRPQSNSPFVIDSVQNNPLLSSTYPQGVSYTELPDLSFQALYFPPESTGRFGRGMPSYGEFSLSGPRVASLRPLPTGVNQIAEDTKRGTFYGINAHDVMVLDLENATSNEMAFPAGIPELSWSVGLTYDSKRDRLLLASLGGEGFLYQFLPSSEEWSVVSSMNNIDLTALTYHAADDFLYGIHEDHSSGVSFLHVFNANGALLESMKLGLPILPGSINRNANVRLISVDDSLVLLKEPSADPFARTYLISPDTGQVTYVVPEPSTILLMAIGVGIIACYQTYRRQGS